MSPPNTTLSFDNCFRNCYGMNASAKKRKAALAAWNAVIDAAMDAAVEKRDSHVDAHDYEYAVFARDIAEWIGARGIPPRDLRSDGPAT